MQIWGYINNIHKTVFTFQVQRKLKEMMSKKETSSNSISYFSIIYKSAPLNAALVWEGFIEEYVPRVIPIY